MLHLFKISGNIIAFILGLIFISISIAWGRKDDKYYKVVDIKLWEDIVLEKIKLEKSKVILEKELIKIIISNEEFQ